MMYICTGLQLLFITTNNNQLERCLDDKFLASAAFLADQREMLHMY